MDQQKTDSKPKPNLANPIFKKITGSASDFFDRYLGKSSRKNAKEQESKAKEENGENVNEGKGKETDVSKVSEVSEVSVELKPTQMSTGLLECPFSSDNFNATALSHGPLRRRPIYEDLTIPSTYVVSAVEPTKPLPSPSHSPSPLSPNYGISPTIPKQNAQDDTTLKEKELEREKEPDAEKEKKRETAKIPVAKSGLGLEETPDDLEETFDDLEDDYDPECDLYFRKVRDRTLQTPDRIYFKNDLAYKRHERRQQKKQAQLARSQADVFQEYLDNVDKPTTTNAINRINDMSSDVATTTASVKNTLPDDYKICMGCNVILPKYKIIEMFTGIELCEGCIHTTTAEETRINRINGLAKRTEVPVSALLSAVDSTVTSTYPLIPTAKQTHKIQKSKLKKKKKRLNEKEIRKQILRL